MDLIDLEGLKLSKSMLRAINEAERDGRGFRLRRFGREWRTRRGLVDRLLIVWVGKEKADYLTPVGIDVRYAIDRYWDVLGLMSQAGTV